MEGDLHRSVEPLDQILHDPFVEFVIVIRLTTPVSTYGKPEFGVWTHSDIVGTASNSPSYLRAFWALLVYSGFT